MKKFLSLFFTLALVVTSQSCNSTKGLGSMGGALSPATALSGVQALLGGASGVALKGLTGNVLGNSIMQNAMPASISNITNLLSASPKGTKAMGLLNGAIGATLPNIASGILGDATNGIAAADAMSLLKGGDTGATDFLKKATSKKLSAALLPALTEKLTANGGMTALKSALGGDAAALLGGSKLSVPHLLSSGAVNGLFDMMGNAEKAERANPTDPLLKDILGKLK